MANFFIVAGNTAPAHQITCKRGSTAIDLSDATSVVLITKNRGTGSITQQGKAASIITAASGIISYTPASTDFPTKGSYISDVKITYSGGGVEILYKYVTWKCRDKIA